MTAGYVLGERHRRDTPAGSSPTQTSGLSNLASSAPSVSVNGPDCPDPAQQTAATLYATSDLKQIFKIVTDNKTTVWICEDPRGSLFYQSHTLLGGKDLPLKQGQNGLFLSGVTRGGDGFEVYDQKRNRFEVGREKLQIFFVGGKIQSDDVDTVEG